MPEDAGGGGNGAGGGAGGNGDGDGPEAREDGASIRPFWSGVITFGLVSVRVNLFAAYRSGRPSLRMVDEDGTPLERRYYCPEHGRELRDEEIVRGYEVEEGRFVVVRDEELEALEPEKSREIDLRIFVDRSALEPVAFQRAYFLTPSDDATKPYRLLARTMEETGRAGIATFVMRGNEYLVAILADGGILRAETMRFHDELRSPGDVGLPEPEDPDEETVERMAEAVESRAGDFDPSELRSRWPARLRELVDEKRSDREDVVEPEDGEEARPSEGAEIIDIMEVLKRNLGGEGAGDGEPAGGDGGGTGAGDGDGGPSREELRERTRDELYDRARELDVRGRSKMNKDALVEAIRRAT